MNTINKLTMTLRGSGFLDINGELQLKVYTYDVDKATDKTVTIRDGIRSVRRKRSEIGVVLSEHHNNTFECITFYAYCEEHEIEEMTELLKAEVKMRFAHNEKIYLSAKSAVDGGIKVVTSV